MYNLYYLNILFFLIFLFLCFQINNYLNRKFNINFLDRKNEVLQIGGPVIFLTLFVSFFYNTYNEIYFSILILSLLILIVGAVDDCFKISIILRFLLFFIIIILIIYFEFKIINLGEYEIIGELKLGDMGLFITFLAFLALINGFNFIDGMDGLLSSIIINAIIFLIINLKLSNLSNDITFELNLLIILLIFLFFNFGFIKNLKMILGDSGSLSLSLIIGLLLIYHANYNSTGIHPSQVLWLISLPLFDVVSTSLKRIIDNKNPFTSDNNHIHYMLKVRTSYSDKSIVLILFLLSIILNIFGMFIYYYFGSLINLCSFVFIALLYLIVNLKYLKA